MFCDPRRRGVIAKKLPRKRSPRSVAVLRVQMGLHKPGSALWSGPHGRKLGVAAVSPAEGKVFLGTRALDGGLINMMP